VGTVCARHGAVVVVDAAAVDGCGVTANGAVAHHHRAVGGADAAATSPGSPAHNRQARQIYCSWLKDLEDARSLVAADADLARSWTLDGDALVQFQLARCQGDRAAESGGECDGISVGCLHDAVAEIARQVRPFSLIGK